MKRIAVLIIMIMWAWSLLAQPQMAYQTMKAGEGDSLGLKVEGSDLHQIPHWFRRNGHDGVPQVQHLFSQHRVCQPRTKSGLCTGGSGHFRSQTL